MFSLPEAVRVEGKLRPIRDRGDYRIVLGCFRALNDTRLTQRSRIIASLVIFYDGMKNTEDVLTEFNDIKNATREMFNFFNCNQENIGRESDVVLVDWVKDEPIIASAINAVAKREVRADPYIHWWTFMGYYLAVGECPLSTVVSIRSKIIKHKKLEKWELDFQRSNPSYFHWNSQPPDRLQEAQDFIEMWNKNSNNGR